MARRCEIGVKSAGKVLFCRSARGRAGADTPIGRLGIASVGAESAKLPTRKAALVVAALALTQKRMSRQVLCDLFWPNREEAQARSSLRQALTAIRKLFPDDGSSLYIEGDIERVELVARSDDVDAWHFDALLETNEVSNLASAADLYQGDVLSGINVPEPLDQWFAQHQRAYRRKALELVEHLSQMQGPHVTAAEVSCEALAERLLSADTAAEEAHRALIRVYQRQGRMNEALRQFDLCKEALKRELGVEPEPQTCALIANRTETVRPTDTDAAALLAHPRRRGGAAAGPRTAFYYRDAFRQPQRRFRWVLR